MLRLATDLRDNGVNVLLDRWHLRPGEESGPFMARSVEQSDKVIVVCTARYTERAERREGGAGFESALVTAELVNNQGTARFIPIIRDNPQADVPSFLRGRIYVDFRSNDRYEEQLTLLLRTVHDLPGIDPPPVGPNPFAAVPTDTQAAQGERDRMPGTVLTPGELEILLQEPTRRIQLSKSLWEAAEHVRGALRDAGLDRLGVAPTRENLVERVDLTDAALRPLGPVLAVGGRWAEHDQIALVANAVAYLFDLPEPSGTYFETNLQIARYPALQALYAAALGAMSEGRWDNLRVLLGAPVPAKPNSDTDVPLVVGLHRGAPFAQPYWKLLPDMDKRFTPVADHLFEVLGGPLSGVLPHIRSFERLFARAEVYVSLAYRDATYSRAAAEGWVPLGRFAWRDPMIFKGLLAEVEASGSGWPPLEAGLFGGSVDRAVAVIRACDEHLGKVRAQNGMY